jgi:hypothetical protein
MKYHIFFKLALIFFCLLSSFASQAQREASIWYFGQRTGFIFSDGKVNTVEDSGNNISNGSAAITFADRKSGQLLFYGNATSLWNRKHQFMPHGDSLAPQGFNKVPQAVLAVPAPSKENQYYIFTLVNDQTTALAVTSLSYSLVDMNLNNGLGDVVAGTKNQIAGGGYGYQFTAVPHANGQDYWVLIRRWDEPIFDTYLLTIKGIALTHSQRIGPIQALQPSGASGGDGFLKASPDGKKLVYLVSDYPQLSLFDFNANTGIMSHYLSLGNLLSPGGVSFSPDNSKLYVQNYSQTPSPNYVGGRAYNVISQYDVTAGSDAAVVASGMSILVDNPTTNIRVDNQSSQGDYTMQLGSDGKLYANSNYLDPTIVQAVGQANFYVINFPNRRGFACDAQYQTFVFNGAGNTCCGLPNFLQSYFNNLESKGPVAEPCEFLTISPFPNPTASSFQLQVPASCFKPYQIILYDALGQRVYQQVVSSALSQNLEIDSLAPGLYYLEAKFADKTLRAKLTKL